MEDKPKEILELERALGIDHVDDYVFEGNHLISLSIIQQNLIDITPLSKFQNLVKLILNANQISDLSPLNGLSRLNFLDLHSNEIIDISPLSNLKSIIYLNLELNQIKDISSLSELKKLNELRLSGNLIFDLCPLAGLKDLCSLELFNNKIYDISPLAEMTSLNHLVLSYNQISDISPIVRLKNLDGLYLFNNRIIDISSLSYLENLYFIDLRNNLISDLVPLKFFISNGLDILINRDEKSKYSFKNEILIGENPLENPPISIIEQGNQAVLAYFERIEKEKQKGTRPINEAKMIIIGEPESGKTTLMNYLQGKPFTVPSTTQGFTIERWIIEKNETNYRINIWDFGGQDIQSTVHQFFLTQDTLYVMVLNARKDELPDKYIEQIKSYAPDSPIIIVVNRIEENPSYEMGVKRLQETHKDKEGNSLIKGVFKVSLLKGHKELDPSYFPILEEMKQAIQKMLLEMPHIHRSVPITYLDVKEYLESAFFEDKPYISHDTYEQICREKGLNVESDDDLLGYLNNLGTVRYFDDLSLRNLQILNPEWLSDGVYRILVSERTKHLRGIITEKDFEPILQKTEEHQFVYPKKHYNYLIQMIRKFDIGYYDEDTNRIFIPRAFGLDYMQNFNNTLYKNEAIHFFFKYESFIPSIIMPAFITRMFGMVKDQLYSQNGVVLEQDGQFALVEQTTVKNRIDIWVSGDKSKGEYFEFFIEVRKVFREFHEKRPGLVVDEMIGLGKNSDVSVKYKQLIANKINGVNDYIGEDGIKYNIDELLGRFESKKDSNIAIATQNIFNNYGRDMYAGYIQIQYLASEIAEELDQIIANINDEHKKELEKLSDELKQLQSARSGSEANSILSQIKNTVKTLPKLISEEAVKWGTKEGLGGLNISDMLIGVQKNILHLLQNPNIGNFIDGNQNLM